MKEYKHDSWAQKQKKIPLFYPFVPKKAILKEISDTLSGRWLGEGPKVVKFEEAFGKKMGYKYPLFVNSGTSALELAYHLIGLKEGDEVIVPVFNCSAGQMGLKRRGVTIVWADIDNNMNLSLDSLTNKITDKTKAIVVVNMGGIPANPAIYKLAKSLNIPTITDSAQHHAHTLGDYIVYSFQAIKHITTCDGGMLILKDKKTHKRARLLRWFGIDRVQKAKHNYQAWERREMTFDVFEAGYKYQPTDIDACFGLASLPYLNKVIAYRKKLAETYRKLLPIDIRVITGGSYWLLTITSNERDALAKYLTEHNIENNLIHLRNDIYHLFGGKRQRLPVMDFLEDKYLCLPLNCKISLKQVRYICKIVNQFYDRTVS